MHEDLKKKKQPQVQLISTKKSLLVIKINPASCLKLTDKYLHTCTCIYDIMEFLLALGNPDLHLERPHGRSYCLHSLNCCKLDRSSVDMFFH